MEHSKIKWTIISLSEVQLKSKGCITLNNAGHIMYYSGGNECQCGVGFVVNKSIAGNVMNFKGQSDRVAEIAIRLNQWYQLKCIQVYMPTSNHTDEEVEQVYEDIDNILSNSRAHYNIVMGDFNAKVGPRQHRKVHWPIWLGRKELVRRHVGQFHMRRHVGQVCRAPWSKDSQHTVQKAS